MHYTKIDKDVFVCLWSVDLFQCCQLAKLICWFVSVCMCSGLIFFLALALLLISFGWNVLFGFSCVKEKKGWFLCEERNFKRRMKLLVQLFPFLCKVPSVRIFRSLFKLSLLGKCIILGSFYTSLVCIEILTDADIHYFSDFVVYFRMWSLCFCFCC